MYLLSQGQTDRVMGAFKMQFREVKMWPREETKWTFNRATQVTYHSQTPCQFHHYVTIGQFHLH